MKNVLLYIDGAWAGSSDGRTISVLNPASGVVVGTVAHATRTDLERAASAAVAGFAKWRKVSAFDRSKLLRAAAANLLDRADVVGPLLTAEQGKPLAQAKGEVTSSADLIDWFAEEARRTYGRVIPARADNVTQLVVKEPVGPVAGFTPWNFPIAQAARKVGAALAAGCSIVLKGSEETPASCAELVRAVHDAGVPPGVVNLVYGEPAQISGFLIPHPGIRKVSFTGSTAVGKELAALAGRHMKRMTAELGGHAPAIVFDDADVASAVQRLAAIKYRNAGQVCASPVRFLIQERVYGEFVERFATASKALKVGNGMQDGVEMGPLANERQLQAVERYVADAVQRGGRVVTGGRRIGNSGNFFEPTVLTDVPRDARIMNEEPFGPVAVMLPFAHFDEAVAEANRLAYGLASYAFTRSAATATAVAKAVEAGMVSINHAGLGLPEIPFGGVKDSGYGSEGGLEAMEPYLEAKLVTQASD